MSRFESEMMAAQLTETTMDPNKRTLLRVVLLEDAQKDTEKSVERLMGTKPKRASPSSRSAPNSPKRICWTFDFPSPPYARGL